MTAVSLERLEHEVAESMRCGPCTTFGNDRRLATHLAVYRETCAHGGAMHPTEPDLLLCAEHAGIVATRRIGVLHGPDIACQGCGHPVAAESFSHIIARIAPLGLPR